MSAKGANKGILLISPEMPVMALLLAGMGIFNTWVLIADIAAMRSVGFGIAEQGIY